SHPGVDGDRHRRLHHPIPHAARKGGLSMTDTVTRREARSGRRALLLVIPVALVSMAPLVWAGVSSLRPGDEIFRYLSPLSWRTLLPTSVSLDNYASVLQGPFALALVNSVIVAFIGVALGLLVAALAGYALAVLPFPGRTAVFAF